jgi:hypothetical protein
LADFIIIYYLFFGLQHYLLFIILIHKSTPDFEVDNAKIKRKEKKRAVGRLEYLKQRTQLLNTVSPPSSEERKEREKKRKERFWKKPSLCNIKKRHSESQWSVVV